MDVLKSGDTFGIYTIENLLGTGGMADVYLVKDGEGNRFAIKILHGLYTRQEENHLRFKDEIRAVKSLSHPGIVSVTDVGDFGGRYYCVMEYLDGGSLRDKIKSGLSVKKCIEIILDLAKALEYAHLQGYIHRDIKPENILFNFSGEPVITDFGVAKSLISSNALTKTGTGVGTPYYMSPEQARGADNIDGRADIYSLGILFYEMLIGEVPYDGDSAVSVIMKHVESPIPVLPRYLNAMQLLLDRMISKAPEQRYKDCSALISDLEHLLDEEEVAEQKKLANTTMVDIVTGTDKSGRFLGLAVVVSVLFILLFSFIYSFLNFDSENFGEQFPTVMTKSLHDREPKKKTQIQKDSAVVETYSAEQMSEGEQDAEILTEKNEQQIQEKETEEKALMASEESIKVAEENNLNEEPVNKDNVNIKTVNEEANNKTNSVADKTEKVEEAEVAVAENSNDIPPEIKIETEPTGAQIFINSRPFGKTPYYGREIAAGRHIIELKLKNYQSYTGELEPKRGGYSEVKVKLVKAFGDLEVKSEPTGATIFIDGKDSGKTTPSIISTLDAGEHSLELKLPRYYPHKQKINIIGNETLRISKQLEGGDLIIFEGKLMTKEQQVDMLLQRASQFVKKGQLYSENSNDAYHTYKKVLEITPNNSAVAKGMQTIAVKTLEIASYYCEEEKFQQCFEYIRRAKMVDADVIGAAELLSDSITRLSWKKVIAGDSPDMQEAARFIRKDYNLDQEEEENINEDYQEKVKEIEQNISVGNWGAAANGITFLESKINKNAMREAKVLRKKYLALKDYYQNGRIIRDRLKDGTLAPRMIVVPFMKMDRDNLGNNRLYLLSETEISNRQYHKYLKSIGQKLSGGNGKNDYPVVNIDYSNAQKYVEWLSQQTGKKYRLPQYKELVIPFSYRQKQSATRSLLCSAFLNYEDIDTGKANALGLIGYNRNVWEITASCASKGCGKVYAVGGAVEDKTGAETGFETVSFCNSGYKDKRVIKKSDSGANIGIRILREM